MELAGVLRRQLADAGRRWEQEHVGDAVLDLGDCLGGWDVEPQDDPAGVAVGLCLGDQGRNRGLRTKTQVCPGTRDWVR